MSERENCILSKYCPNNPNGKNPPGEFGKMVDNMREVDPRLVLPDSCKRSVCPYLNEDDKSLPEV